MPNKANVVNTGAASTTASAADAPADVKQQASGSSPGGNATQSAEEGLAAVINQAYQNSIKSQTGDAEETDSQEPDVAADMEKALNGEVQGDDSASKDSDEESDETSTEDSAEGAEGDGEASSEEGEEQEGEGTDEAQKPVPYKRFNQVLQEKNEAVKQAQTYKPLALAQQRTVQFCQEHDLDAQDFINAMHLAAALKNNPLQAKELLAPIVAELGLTGEEALPPDIQQLVDGGLDIKIAKRLAEAERDKKHTLKVRERMEARQQAQAQRQVIADLQTALNSWTRTKQTTDPSFRKNSNGEDGKFEFFVAKFQQEYNNELTPQQAVALAERVYASVNKSFRALNATANGTRVNANPVRTAQSRSGKQVSGTTKQPTTLLEVTRAVARKHGLNV